MRGHPYDTDTSFSKWLELQLAFRDPGRHYEMINCGGMSYASYRLIPILQEVLAYEPDLILVMTGHNEFLEDRTYQDVKHRSAARAWVEDQLFSLRMVTVSRRAVDGLRRSGPSSPRPTTLPPDVDALLDHESGYASYHRDEPWRSSVSAHFEMNLRAMVQLCRQQNVPIVLINPGSNLRDCPPFKSENSLDQSQLSLWTKCYQKAQELAPSDPAQALVWYRQAESIDGEHAKLVYDIARCLDRLGQYNEARSAYLRAKELDVCPLRILNNMQRSILQVADETETPLVDADDLLVRRSRHGIVGYDWYVDQVHPSIRGHQLIAEAIAAKLEQEGLVSLKRNWMPSQRRKIYQNQLESLGQLYLAAGRKRVEWLESWGRRDRLSQETTALDARENLDWGQSYLEFGAGEHAHDAFRLALQEAPGVAEDLQQRAFELFQSGRPQSAREISELVLDLAASDTLRDRAKIALAVLAFDEGQHDEARQIAETYQSTQAANLTADPWLLEVPQARTLFKP